MLDIFYLDKKIDIAYNTFHTLGCYPKNQPAFAVLMDLSNNHHPRISLHIRMHLSKALHDRFSLDYHIDFALRDRKQNYKYTAKNQTDSGLQQLSDIVFPKRESARHRCRLHRYANAAKGEKYGCKQKSQ